MPEALESAKHAADYLSSQLIDEGRLGFGQRYSGEIPETVHLYVLPALYEASNLLNKPNYGVLADRCLEYYLNHRDFLQLSNLTHFLGYEIEALIDLGHAEKATHALDQLAKKQSRDGAVSGKSGVSWICEPGLAQLAICWYKTGRWEAADKAMMWLDAHQRQNGGFLGSHGLGASYFPNVELSWAAKFYLDAHLLRVSRLRHDVTYAETPISMEDLTTILPDIKANSRILETGLPQSVLEELRETRPNLQISTMQTNPETKSAGMLESIPHPSNWFDIAICGREIELAVHPYTAMTELMRVTKPGGQVLIVVNNGSKQSVPWAWSPNRSEICRVLNQQCDDVRQVDCRSALVWCSTKRARLSGKQWNKVLISESSRRAILERIRRNKYSEWGQLVAFNSKLGERVLEIGSGTGEISLQLAQAGRVVSTLDVSADSLTFISECAHELGVKVSTYQVDATGPLPFPDDAFDCTWSSGLLEHFTSEERRTMLREWSRITLGRVITLVPNASSLAYRIGKKDQELRGIWPYGLEMPILTMRADFEAAGIKVINEFSVAPRHALTFIHEDNPLRRWLSALMEKMPHAELQGWNQGYLLVTIGSRLKRSKT